MDVDKIAKLFPLHSRKDVLKLIDSLITSENQNLVLISLILGAVEHELTGISVKDVPDVNSLYSKVDFKVLKSLHDGYLEYLKKPVLIEKTFTNDDDEEKTKVGRNGISGDDTQMSKREKIKEIYNKVWFKLARSYRKDRHHMQTIYSLLTDQKLDSFGVSISVVVSCHLLNHSDVTLIMSEDHSWIEFQTDNFIESNNNNHECNGDTPSIADDGSRNGYQSMEVTWHGKQTKDKRGCRVADAKRRWLASGGHAIRCNTTRSLVVAMVTKMNAIVDGEEDSIELANLKFDLLKMLYKNGCLNQYPQALLELYRMNVWLFSRINMHSSITTATSTASSITTTNNDNDGNSCIINSHNNNNNNENNNNNDCGDNNNNEVNNDDCSGVNNFQEDDNKVTTNNNNNNNGDDNNNNNDLKNDDSHHDDGDDDDRSPIVYLQKAIDVNQSLYNQSYVHPYLEMAKHHYHHHHRHHHHRLNVGDNNDDDDDDDGTTINGEIVMKCWRTAADVVSKYIYSKEDEELYKLFYDIANNHIPDLIKGPVITNGHNHSIKINEDDDCSVGETISYANNHANISHTDYTKIRQTIKTETSKIPIENWKNPRIFSDFLLFYDGLCCWEEHSSVPVLHETWAKRMCASLIRFHHCARDKSKVAIETGQRDTDGVGNDDDGCDIKMIKRESADCVAVACKKFKLSEDGTDYQNDKDGDDGSTSQNGGSKLVEELKYVEFKPMKIDAYNYNDNSSANNINTCNNYTNNSNSYISNNNNITNNNNINVNNKPLKSKQQKQKNSSSSSSSSSLSTSTPAMMKLQGKSNLLSVGFTNLENPCSTSDDENCSRLSNLWGNPTTTAQTVTIGKSTGFTDINSNTKKSVQEKPTSIKTSEQYMKQLKEKFGSLECPIKKRKLVEMLRLKCSESLFNPEFITWGRGEPFLAENNLASKISHIGDGTTSSISNSSSTITNSSSNMNANGYSDVPDVMNSGVGDVLSSIEELPENCFSANQHSAINTNTTNITTSHITTSNITSSNVAASNATTTNITKITTNISNNNSRKKNPSLQQHSMIEKNPRTNGSSTINKANVDEAAMMMMMSTRRRKRSFVDANSGVTSSSMVDTFSSNNNNNYNKIKNNNNNVIATTGVRSSKRLKSSSSSMPLSSHAANSIHSSNCNNVINNNHLNTVTATSTITTTTVTTSNITTNINAATTTVTATMTTTASGSGDDGGGGKGGGGDDGGGDKGGGGGGGNSDQLKIVLKSYKMQSIVGLVQSEKLNIQAIKLLLTSQPNVTTNSSNCERKKDSDWSANLNGLDGIGRQSNRNLRRRFSL